MKKVFLILIFISKPTFSQTTYITPHIDGISFCKSAIVNSNIKNNEEAAIYCYHKNEDAASTIKSALNKIDGGNIKKGNFSLGYTLTIPLLRYYQKDFNGAWAIDKKFLYHDLDVVKHISRPVNIYLSLNHFTDSNIELSTELAKNEKNIMWDAKGPMPISNYFGNPVIPWTIADMSAPITQYRENIFKAALIHIHEITKEFPGRVIGVSILGEVHQMNRDIMAGPSYSVDMNDLSDYSPAAIEGFRKWLTLKFRNIEKLNQFANSKFDSFSAVPIPTKNIRKDKLKSYFEHNDTFSTGSMDIYGWLADNRKCKQDISVYLDGEKIGNADYGLNRTDVSQAIGIKNPNLGFRYPIDFRKIKFGIHRIWITEKCGNENEVLLGQRSFVYVDRKQDKVETVFDHDAKIPPYGKNIRVSIDGPNNMQDVYFNPISLLWQRYREIEVKNYIQHFAGIASEYIPAEMIYSHQITTELNGSWNEKITAEAESKKQNGLYNNGTTLYGGAAFGDLFFLMAQREGWKRYSVSEMNPMSDIGVDGYKKMLYQHNYAGAIFISPYFISVISDSRPAGGLDMFELRPGNTKVHSDQFYEALKEIMK